MRAVCIGCGAAQRDCGDLLDGRPESYSRRAALRPDRRWPTGASWAFDAASARAFGRRGHARAPATLAPSAGSTATLAGTRRRGGGRARAPRRNVRGPSHVTSTTRARFPGVVDRDAPSCDASRDPSRTPLPHASAPNDRIRRRRRRRPRAAARHSPPRPRSRWRWSSAAVAPISRRRRAPPIANSHGLKPRCHPPRRRRRRRTPYRLEAEQAARRASWTPADARGPLINDTTVRRPGVFSALGTCGASSGGSILVAAAIRNIVEDAQRQDVRGAMGRPLGETRGPDGLRARRVQGVSSTVRV